MLDLFRSSSLLLVLLLVVDISAHTLWSCPSPRTSDAGLKVGPCGGVGEINDTASPRTVVSPGPLLVSWQEPVFHMGAPFRIALSVPGEDYYESCILINHIPHNDAGSSNQLYYITIDIPNIYCEDCALQIIQVMTDKIPQGETCNYNPANTTSSTNGQCFSNYHSCANIMINGTTNLTTTTLDQELCSAWLNKSWQFDTFNPYHYTQESGVWQNGWLVDSRSPNQIRSIPSTSPNSQVCIAASNPPENTVAASPAPSKMFKKPPVITVAPTASKSLASSSSKLSSRQITGIVLGALGFAVIVGALTYWRVKSRQGKYHLEVLDDELTPTTK